jgi:hypothetical protein
MRKLIYGDIATPKILVAPQNASAGTVNGVVIDRIGYYDAIAHLSCGATTGAPTAQSAKLTIYHGELEDGSDMTVYNAVEGLGGGAYETGVVASDNIGTWIDVDLAGAKRYIRGVVTVAFTGGTTPKQLVAATLILGQNTAPITQSN